MTSQYRHRRSSDPTKAFVQLEPGEIAVNTANRQLALGDAASGAVGNPLQLLPLRFFDTRAIYAAGDLVYYQNVVYRSIGVSGPGAFTPPQWTMLVGVIDAQYVAKAGDTMTGALTLSGNPSDGLHAAPKQYVDGAVLTRIADTGDTMTGPLALPAPSQPEHATNKAYVDAALANKSSVVSSDTPPPAPVDNTLWFETDTGLLYVRYNDGNSTQWVIACPQPDTSLFVQRTGDTMTGPLVLPATDPTLATHSTNKAYVDKTAKSYSGKNYIVNGAMQISQENGANSVGNNTYPVDQFLIYTSSAATFTAQQVGVNTPGGSFARVRLTVTVADAAVAATDYALFAQKIEAYRVSDLKSGSTAAKTVTIQFGVKAPAGTYCIALRNNAGDRAYVAEYVIAAGEANTEVVKSVTIALDKAGVWTTSDNSTGLSVNWCLMAGANTQQAAGAWAAGGGIGSPSQFNFFGTIGNVFELFDVSLTEGTVAPPFAVPDYADELAACQRYFCKLGGGGASDNVGAQFVANATGYNLGAWFNFPVQMRTLPTTTKVGTWLVSNISQPTVAFFSTTGVSMLATAAGAGGAYFYTNSTGTYVTANARL